MTFGTHDLDRIDNATAYGPDGDRIGKVGHVYLDDQTSEPTWVTVNTGLFGSSQSFVPLEGATVDGDDLRLAHTKDKVKDAPRMDTDQHLDRHEEEELYRYYGLSYGGTTGAAGTTDTVRDADAATSTVAHEERLKVGAEAHEADRVRLRKYATTETENVSVPVTKEKLSVERTPVSGEAAVSSGTTAEGQDEVEEITLREERPVVDKETVAVEEVSVGKEAVTETEKVSGEVRKEHVEVDAEGAAVDADHTH